MGVLSVSHKRVALGLARNLENKVVVVVEEEEVMADCCSKLDRLKKKIVSVVAVAAVDRSDHFPKRVSDRFSHQIRRHHCD